MLLRDNSGSLLARLGRTMTTSVPRILGACALIVVVGVLLFSMLYSPVTPAPSAQTRSGLAQADLVLRLVRAERPSYLESVILPLRTDRVPYEVWCKLIDDNLDLIGLQPEKARAILSFDAWSTEFNVLPKEALPRDQCAQRLLDKELPLVIWSSGPNRSNEFGQGDDVVYSPPNAIAQPASAGSR